MNNPASRHSPPDHPDKLKILMVDDDEDDRIMFEDAVLDAQHLIANVEFAVDGIDLMDRLNFRGEYASMEVRFFPDLILLDLNMPRMNGHEVLEKIQQNPVLKQIPIVVLTTSSTETDIVETYNLGASGYITKPVTFESLVDTIRSLAEYWVNVVKLPKRA